MKITIKNDFRKFKAGEVFDFTGILKELKTVCIVGENGCGKSSLFHALRGLKNDMRTQNLTETDFKKLADNIEVEHSYDKIFYFDNVKDNGSDMMVAYDASNYFESGGFYTKDKSHGESSLIYISMFLEKLYSKLKKEEKTLIVLDEVDNGFSLKNMALYNNLVQNLVRKNCDVIVISHNPFVMFLNVFVYDFAKKLLSWSDKYIKEQTDFEMKWLKEDIKPTQESTNEGVVVRTPKPKKTIPVKIKKKSS